MRCLCAHCGKPAELVTGERIYQHRPDLYSLNFWLCEPCSAYVGCHKAGVGYGDGTAPLGTPANAELREWRKITHSCVDAYWKSGWMKRKMVYTTLTAHMNLGKAAHIGEFNKEQCTKAIKITENELLWSKK